MTNINTHTPKQQLIIAPKENLQIQEAEGNPEGVHAENSKEPNSLNTKIYTPIAPPSPQEYDLESGINKPKTPHLPPVNNLPSYSDNAPRPTVSNQPTGTNSPTPTNNPSGTSNAPKPTNSDNASSKGGNSWTACYSRVFYALESPEKFNQRLQSYKDPGEAGAGQVAISVVGGTALWVYESVADLFR